MSSSNWLTEPAKAGVYHLTGDSRELAQAAQASGLAVFVIDIGHAHDKKDFIAALSRAMNFPDWFGGNADALADSLKDLSWVDAKGWVVILEKSKHFCAGHRHEFEEAMDVMADAAEYWRGQGRAFWTLIGGPDGWKSGWPEMPAA